MSALFTRLAASRLLIFASLLCLNGATLSAQESLAEKYLDDDDGLVLEVDLTEVMKSKDFQPLFEIIDTGDRFRDQVGVSMRDIRTFAMASRGPDEGLLNRFVLSSSSGIDVLQLMRTNRWVKPNDVPETLQHRDQTYYAVDSPQGQLGVFQPDERSLVVNSLEEIERLVRGQRPKQSIQRSREWKELEEFNVRLAVGEKLYTRWREEYERFNQNGGGQDPLAQLLLPLNQKVDQVLAGFSLGGDLKLRISIYSKNSTAAKDVESSLKALLQIGKSYLKPMQMAALEEATDEPSRKIAEEGFMVLNRFVDSLQFQRIGREVRVTAETDVRPFLKNVLPDAVAAARVAARRTQSANNMKQLGLSMHNYYDVNKSMPPAVIIGPKGHPHSWRVAVLPYLGEQELYEQYRFDEPWDSPNNQKVMERMPETFRHPNDPPGSTSTRYLAFVGPGTAFEKAEGVKFQEIRDGTSNTAMFFSGATNVPWTKPVDIPYDPEQELTFAEGPFKEGFHMVMFDGSVQFFPANTPPEKFRRLIEINDGQPIEE